MLKARHNSLENAIKDLRIGDIVLLRRKKGFLRLLIGDTTKSYWTHVALVFHISRISAFPPAILIVEANDDGIEIHRLDHYINNPKFYELGFKRMKGLTEEERERFRGFYLDAVDTPYDHRRIETFLAHFYFERLTGKTYQDFITKRVVNPDNFICTTFAQRAYYLAVAPSKRSSVLFRKEEPGVNFLERMELITPYDISSSECTSWLYNPHL